MEAIKNDLGMRETVANDREIRRIHIHTYGFNGFAGFPGIAHEIADESGHSTIRKDIEDLTGFRVKKEKRHGSINSFDRAKLVKTEMRGKKIPLDFKILIELLKKGIHRSMRNRVTESDIFFRILHLGVEDNGETSVIGNETMRGNDGSRSRKSMAAMFTKKALFFEAEISGAAGNGRQGDEGGFRTMFNDSGAGVGGSAERTGRRRGIRKQAGKDKGINTTN